MYRQSDRQKTFRSPVTGSYENQIRLLDNVKYYILRKVEVNSAPVTGDILEIMCMI